jgi:hypothetical protein
MLTPDRNQQLDDLLGTSIADFDIPDDVYQRAVARYSALGAWLSDYWDASPDDGIVYPQGSFRLGTVVQPVNPADNYDIDLVCRRDISKTSTTQAALKADCGIGIASYIATAPDGTPTASEGKRCWTLDYPREPFHIDVLPAIPNADGKPNAILLTDRELRAWQHSNPIDYAAWFHGTMRSEFLRARELVAKRMDIADVPAWRVKTTLQRTVQALKRHRDLYFAENPDDKPASIIVTTLAALAYIGGGALYEVLAAVSSKMPDLIEVRSGVYWVANPVHPEENFADRWRDHPERAQRFFEWIAQAHVDFTGYGTDLGVDRVLEKLAKSFGEGPARRAGESLGRGIARTRDAAALGMAGTGVLAASPAPRPVPRHTFHGALPSSGR